MDEPQLFTDGEAYERHMGRWSAMVGRPFLDWLAVPKGLKWLDAGCGTGAFTETIIAQAEPSAIMGIDPSKDQLAYARQRPGTKLAEFQVGDAQELPFANGRFDAAVMALVIAFVPEPAKAVKELRRLVRPGGWVAAYMWDLTGGGLPFAPLYAALKSMNATPPLPPSSDASRLEVMQALWNEAGLEQVETAVFRITVSFASFEEFWEVNTLPVGPLGKFLETLAPEAKDGLRSRLRENLPRAPDGRIVYESFANAVKGRTPP